MHLIIGRFELDVHLFELFLRIPYVGEMYWHPQTGLVSDRWSTLPTSKPSSP